MSRSPPRAPQPILFCATHRREAPMQPTPYDFLYLYLCLFFIYSFVGVILEMTYCWTIEYRGIIESRLGILYLPFNPLYGLGGVAVTILLVPFFRNPFLIFLIGLVVCTALEYI